MDFNLILSIIAGLCCGYCVFYCVKVSTGSEVLPNAIKWIAGLICSITFSLIYLYQGFNNDFLVFSIFTVCLVILIITDLIAEIVDDQMVLAGLLLLFPLLVYMEKTMDAILGACMGFLVSGVVYFVANTHFTMSREPGRKAGDDEPSFAQFKLAFVPSLAAAVAFHALLPEGLPATLVKLFVFLQGYDFAIAVFSGVSLVWLWTKRRVTQSSYEALRGDSESSEQAFGGGDITISILIGMVLGWQAIIAVFWLGLILHVLFGLVVYYFGNCRKCKRLITKGAFSSYDFKHQ